MNARVTIATLSKQIITEADAYRHLEGMRWSGAPVCAHCDGTDVYLIPPANGVSRKTAAGKMSERRVWKCRECKRQFSVLTGTIMHATKISVRTWVLVIFDMCASKNGISAREVERRYGVSARSAWHMLHRIRHAMANHGSDTMVGLLVADETWIGGDPKNDHHYKPQPKPEVFQPGSIRPNQHTDKTPVLCLINAETGEARSAVVADVTGKPLRKAIAQNANIAASHLMTDESSSYKAFSSEWLSHQSVNHSKGEYVRGNVSTNMAENFFSQLKRSIDGTHHHVSKEHLSRYLGEFDFRYTTCKLPDVERMAILGHRLEGRLSYKRVKASN